MGAKEKLPYWIARILGERIVGHDDDDEPVICHEWRRRVHVHPRMSEEYRTREESRERKGLFEWNPSRSLLASIRRYQRCRGKWWGLPFYKAAVIRHRIWSAVTGTDIPLNCRIGAGLLMPHPAGIVVHDLAIIGSNCIIFSCVTIGTRGDDGVPIIGNYVQVGTGAKILGAVRVGDHAVIGANAVVLHDVPANATVVGNPARETKRSQFRGILTTA